MKTFTLVCAALVLTACNDGGKKWGSLAPAETHNDGVYLIGSMILEGDCGNPPDIQFTVYENAVYDEPSDPDPVIDATIRGERFSGAVVFADGSMTSFEGFIEDGYVSGDWETSDGACFGYFQGEKSDEL